MLEYHKTTDAEKYFICNWKYDGDYAIYNNLPYEEQLRMHRGFANPKNNFYSFTDEKELIGQKWKLPILWYIADAENQTLRYRELERKVVGATATMLSKCLRELGQDQFITRTQYNTIPPTVEHSLAERGKTLIPALESVYHWAERQMQQRNQDTDKSGVM